MEKTKITIETTVSSNTDKVWDCYTNPEHITKWNFAVDDWQCPWAENDLRVGGKFRSRMEAKDGSFGFEFEGIYDEIIPLQKIAYTMPDGRQVIVNFENLDDKTKVTIVFDPENMNPVDFQKAGWQAILENFRKYTEAN
jgi:uncharacterized protein YndB with AHSA1/START domain